MSRVICLTVTAVTLWASLATAAEKPAEPFRNPHLADSSYPAIHAAMADYSPLAGPTGPSRRLQSEEIRYVHAGPIAGWGPIYSSKYPDGRHVIWAGGYDRVAKIDAETLEVLTSYAIGGNTYFGDDEIERHIANLDSLDEAGAREYMLTHWIGPFASAGSSYDLLSRDNVYYMPFRAADNSLTLQAYGEADASDPASPISLLREWKMPANIFKANANSGAFLSVAMTSDGWIAMVTQNGAVVVLSQDFKTHHVLKLPRKQGEGSEDFFASFIRNGVICDDRGGIYVVTRDNMHRVQWTGKTLSLAEKDGAWTVPYPNELGIGSGTTPQLMGWGPKEDHLVAIADGTRGNKFMLLWRDEIPADWQGLPGYDRRVAGVSKVSFGVSENEQVQLENTPVIYGYGAFFNNTYPENRLPPQGSPTRQWLGESFSMYAPGQGGRGGALLSWDPDARELKQTWQTQVNLAGTVCTVSGATEIVYCWGARDGEWTLEGTDWATGESAFHYVLGKSQRFNPIGGMITIAPNGNITCGCAGGLGIVQVAPKKTAAN